MLESQLKDMPKGQQEQVAKMVEENPELFEKIAKEIQEKTKGGMDQTYATMQVMREHQDELRKALGQ